MAEQRVRLTTPRGVAVFPRLNEPDTKFKVGGEYSVKLRLSPTDAEPLLTAIQPLYDAAIAAAKANPKNKGKSLREWPLFTPDLDENRDETGDILFSFKRGASGISKKTGKPWAIAPKLFDAKGAELDAQIWSGSEIKVSFEPNAYDTPTGCGLSLALAAVQVLKLVTGSGGGATSYGFDEVKGEADESGLAVDPLDEDLPF